MRDIAIVASLLAKLAEPRARSLFGVRARAAPSEGSNGETMSELEKLEAEYRRLATKVIYAGFAGDLDPADQARLERLSEELLCRNAIGAADEVPEPVAA